MEDNLKIPQLEDLQLQLFLIELTQQIKKLLIEIQELKDEIEKLKL